MVEKPAIIKIAPSAQNFGSGKPTDSYNGMDWLQVNNVVRIAVVPNKMIFGICRMIDLKSIDFRASAAMIRRPDSFF